MQQNQTETDRLHFLYLYAGLDKIQTWNLAVFKDELARVGASHSQLI